MEHPHIEVLQSDGVHKYVEALLGTRVYLVGGCVRDELLGRQTKDWDFTTGLHVEEIESRVKAAGRHAYVTGKRFGTIGFKTPDGLHDVEVTTFRSDEYEFGSRKPVVTFGSSIVEDLGRRDFTFNAIAKRTDGKIIDPYDGIQDLNDGVVRAVGNARTRFKEDPLRMMRAARFAAVLDMEIEDATFAAMERYAHRILTISRERVVSELDKILMSPNPSVGLRILADSRILNFILPELSIQVGFDQNSKYHSLELWEHTLAVVNGVPEDLMIRWAALLHDVAKPMTRKLNMKTGFHNYVKHDMLGGVMAVDICKRLKMSTDRIVTIGALVTDHLDDDSPLKEADDAAKAVPFFSVGKGIPIITGEV